MASTTVPNDYAGLNTHNSLAGSNNAPVIGSTSGTATSSAGTTATDVKNSAVNSQQPYKDVLKLTTTLVSSFLQLSQRHILTQRRCPESPQQHQQQPGGAESLARQGPVAQTARDEANKTSAQFSNVANSRVTPSHTAATGQSLTHYHSLFFNILSWENPRVTGIAYASIVTFIFFTRYVPILKFFLKSAYTILGIIAAAEVAGKLVFDKGIASQVRPRKYYTIPRQSLENALEDVEQLINFFVIEFQRIVFAENVYATGAAFAAAFVSYFLVKFVPTWGIALISTTAIFFLPLVYIQNRELIDDQLNNASTIINQQATQVRDLAAQQTSRAGEAVKSTVSQYSAQASELVGQAKAKTGVETSSTTGVTGAREPIKTEPLAGTSTSQPAFKREDFPVTPATVPSTTTGGPTERAPVPAHAI